MKIRIRLHFYPFVLAAAITWSGWGCQQESTTPVVTENAFAEDPLFTFLAPEETGVDFANQLTDNPEVNVLTYEYFHNGGGVAIGDINNDGLPDIYFTGNMRPNALYLNEGNFRFRDIAREAGVGGKRGWTTGVTMADVNGDGWLDIYVCRSGNLEPEGRENILFINNGDLTFSERTREFGLNDPSYSTQASFFDYDRDGDLDLFLLNHAIRPARDIELKDQTEMRDPWAGDKLYRNDDGFFQDVSEAAGIIGNPIGYGLGVATSDLNNDGWPDLYVCNDYLEHDYLYFNNGDGTFSEQLHQALQHSSNFSMGTDAADFNNDGWTDIMVADMAAEDNYRSKTNMSGMNPERFWRSVDNGFHHQYMYNTLQLNNGNGTFSDVAQMAGVAKTDWSWAPLWADFDNDGLKDLFVSNGLRREARNNDWIKLKKQKLREMEQLPRNQRMGKLLEILQSMPSEKLNNYVFRNEGDLQFTKKTEAWGLKQRAFSNGAAYADLDADGDLDLVVSNVDDPAFLYRNTSVERQRGHYLKIRLEGPEKNRFGIGSRVTVHTGDSRQVVELFPTRGYLSATEPVGHVGLGTHTTVDKVTITWPDGSTDAQTNVAADQVITFTYRPTAPDLSHEVAATTWFEDITEAAGISFRHQENPFDDYARELLLPHKMSQFGPALAVGDVDGDGQEDFFVGGAKGHAGALYKQAAGNTFTPMPGQAWESDGDQEDLDAAFFDADSDGDLDLYVVSGGNAFEPDDPALQDRLYLNDGNGQFTKATDALPEMLTSGGCVAVADYDQDGDQDLFVGGRVVPGKYPFAPRSYLLRNEGGRFADVTADVAPELVNPGLVTAATWTDFNSDGRPDLLVTGEWMALLFMENDGQGFADVAESRGLSDTEGWWFSLAAADVDGDGDQDYIAGNLGLNYKYQASAEEPFDIYCHDFDANGSLDIVLGFRDEGDLFPLRGRECSSDQMPFIKEKFPDYESFGKATLIDVYEDQQLSDALHYQARTFESAVLRNDGNGRFALEALPKVAQRSAVNGIVPLDLNGDQAAELLLAGNLYVSEVETPRSDAGVGTVLQNSGSGAFQAVPLNTSGFLADRDVKQLKKIQLEDGRTGILVARNDDQLSLLILSSGSLSSL